MNFHWDYGFGFSRNMNRQMRRHQAWKDDQFNIRTVNDAKFKNFGLPFLHAKQVASIL